jgi:hypothetical protein
MGEVERMANNPLPVAHRASRIAALERELDELHRVEEVLVVAAIAAGQPVYRSPSAPPAACWECASRPRCRAPPNQRRRGWSGFKYPLKGPPP